MTVQKPKFIQAWECIGCGRIEAPQPCLGICQDRPMELVPRAAYEQLAEEYGRMREFVLQLALTSPRSDQWEAGYRAAQKRARALVDALQFHPPDAKLSK